MPKRPLVSGILSLPPSRRLIDLGAPSSGAAPFSLASIPNMQGWWNDIGLTSGRVTSWTDQSGNGRHLTASLGPTITTNINGKTCLSWADANNEWLTIVNAAFRQSAAFTCMVVMRMNGGTGIGGISCAADSTTNDGWRISRNGDSSNVSVLGQGPGNLGTATLAPIDTTARLYTIRWDGSQPNGSRAKWYVGTSVTAVSDASNVFTYSSSGRFAVGVYWADADVAHFKGDIGELVYWSRAINATELANAQGALKTKWGV
jgi:hypothetical protein